MPYVKFRATVKAVRRKELPELNDEFAKDLGDFQTVEELKEAIRKNIFHDREHRAQDDAKRQLLDKLVEAHEFPVPEVYIDRQIQINVENQLRALAAQGMDTKDLKLDWHKVRESQKTVPSAMLRHPFCSIRSGSASRRADAVQEEVDREVQNIARRNREAVAVTRAKLSERRRNRQDRGEYSHREDAKPAVREGPQGSGAGAGGDLSSVEEPPRSPASREAKTGLSRILPALGEMGLYGFPRA